MTTKTSRTSKTRKSTAKKSTAKKSTAKKTAARKSPARKTAAAKAPRTPARKAAAGRTAGGSAKAAGIKLTLLERLEGLGLLNQETIEQLEKKAESMKETGDGLGQAAAWDRMLHSGLAAVQAGSGDAANKRALQALVTWQESLLSLPATAAGLEEAVTGLKKIVPYHGASLFVRNPDKKSIESLVTVGFPVELIGRIRFAEGHGFSSWVAARKRPVLYSSLHRNEAPGSEHVRSFMGVPLVVGSESLGVLNLGHREEEAYDPAALRRLMVAAAMLAGLVQRCVAQRQIRAREIVDPVTGLATASYLRARLDEEVIRCRELGHSMSLVVFRLKELGDFTEQFGADFRDRCRTDLAELAQGWRRPTELVGLGKGDTLVAILPSARVERARERAQAMADGVEKHNFPRRKRMTVEFGLATYPSDAESPQELLEAVDKSLREASPAPGETEACALPVAM